MKKFSIFFAFCFVLSLLSINVLSAEVSMRANNQSLDDSAKWCQIVFLSSGRFLAVHNGDGCCQAINENNTDDTWFRFIDNNDGTVSFISRSNRTLCYKDATTGGELISASDASQYNSKFTMFESNDAYFISPVSSKNERVYANQWENNEYIKFYFDADDASKIGFRFKDDFNIRARVVEATEYEPIYFRVNTDKLNVRTGPGANYGIAKVWGEGMSRSGNWSLKRGDIVCTKYKSKNGFVKIRMAKDRYNFEDSWESRWVALNLLTLAEVCETCDGDGYTGDICDCCGGEGCDHEGGEDCCVNGYANCSDCDGNGYR